MEDFLLFMMVLLIIHRCHYINFNVMKIRQEVQRYEESSLAGCSPDNVDKDLLLNKTYLMHFTM